MRFVVKDIDTEEIVLETNNPKKVIAFLKHYLLPNQKRAAFFHDAKHNTTLVVVNNTDSPGSIEVTAREHDHPENEIVQEIADDLTRKFKNPLTRTALFAKTYREQTERMNKMQRDLGKAAEELNVEFMPEILDTDPEATYGLISEPEDPKDFFSG